MGKVGGVESVNEVNEVERIIRKKGRFIAREALIVSIDLVLRSSQMSDWLKVQEIHGLMDSYDKLHFDPSIPWEV